MSINSSLRTSRWLTRSVVGNGLSLLVQPRHLLLLASWLYAYSLHFSHIVYLNPVWDYFGFTLRPFNWLEIVIIFLLITAGAVAMPVRIARPSFVILLLLYIVVYIPAVVFSLSLDVNRLERYGISLMALCFGFVLACMISRLRPAFSSVQSCVPDSRFCRVILQVWVVCCAILIFTYAPIMTFSGLDDIYDQREAGASVSAGMGYAQTYFGNVISPALIAMGLINSKFRLIFIGTVGCVIMYMINAQRTIFLMPIAIILFNFLLNRRYFIFRTTAFPLLLLSGVVLVSSSFYEQNAVASFLSLFIVFRTLSLPGLTFSQYHDLFAADGYTWWSHIKGFDLFVPIPSTFVQDPSWPNLGHIIGDRVYSNVENNVNANLFSGDGLASAGPFGVLVISLVLAAWLRLFDHSTRGWDRRFSVLIALPIGLAMTNGHFFTTMLSFGGIFWLLAFHFYKPHNRAIGKPTKNSRRWFAKAPRAKLT